MLPRENKEVIDPYNEKDVPFDAILPIGRMYKHSICCKFIVTCWHPL
jgi:hypothetical protein